MWIFKVGVVGAGAMGGGIGQVVAYAGLPVVIKDIDQGQLDVARKHIEAIYQSRIDKGKMTTGQVRETLDLIEYTLEYDDFEDADIVIEAVPEIMAIKQQVFRDLDGICPPETIFASNTSALSVTQIGAATGRPQRVIGMHFFNPAHIMKLVEIIPASETDQDTIDTVKQFAQELRKTPVIVQECPGFLVNRLLMPYLNEAVLAVEQGAASTEQVDEAMGRGGFGWPMGPFFLIDMLGMDVCAHIGEYLYSQYGDRVKPAKLFRVLLEAGRLGEKSGAGFYVYSNTAAEPLEAIIQRMQDAGQVETGSAYSNERLIMPFLNEAALCVEEDIANVSDIDMACIAGLGMQVTQDGQLTRMGPLEYMDELGLDAVLANLEELETELGPRFHHAQILGQKVRAGNLGKKTGLGFKEHTV